MLGTASHETRPFLQLTRKISHKFLRRLKAESLKNCPKSSAGQSHAFWVLSKLDEFLLNPQILTLSGTVPGTFRNTNVANQEPNEDRSQDDPHPEVGAYVYQSRHSIYSDTDEAPHRIRLSSYRTSKTITMVQFEDRTRCPADFGMFSANGIIITAFKESARFATSYSFFRTKSKFF